MSNKHKTLPSPLYLPLIVEVREGSCYQIWWIFGKVPKGGGWVFFNPEIYVAYFGNFKQGFLSMKLIQKRVNSGFRVCFFNNCIEKNHIWPSYLLAFCPLGYICLYTWQQCCTKKSLEVENSNLNSVLLLKKEFTRKYALTHAAVISCWLLEANLFSSSEVFMKERSEKPSNFDFAFNFLSRTMRKTISSSSFPLPPLMKPIWGEITWRTTDWKKLTYESKLIL